ncbi:bifunctional nuclease family protein [Flavicella sediminum]|uniref:bifunctional nuclease family protein n=1 Tax=Flavicella sediminum TaxID=2585141 RepID=UPI001121F048|nr:bifunctional nuclease family protein [Flavicella sediminum]
MSLIQLDIKGISYSQTQSGAYALVLTEIDGNRTLPIVIGAFEAQSIAIALEKEIKPPRPLTHDLFKTFSDRFQINVTKVIIHKLVDGVFFSSLICERDGLEEIIDARTSDAIALATRFNAPIFTYEAILEKAGIYLKLDAEEIISDTNDYELEEILGEDSDTNSENELSKLSLKELNEALNNAVSQEDYEAAAIIRDEIDKRV